MLQLVAGMALIMNVWNEMPVQDFIFCHSSFDQLDQRVCILTAELDNKVHGNKYIYVTGSGHA